jgi:hypothetical protein
MIRAALKKGIKVILMTPSPDLQVDFMKPGNELELLANQIMTLANKYKIGVVDSYGLFRQQVKDGIDLKSLMAQSNHPNEKGHLLIARGIMSYFK